MSPSVNYTESDGLQGNDFWWGSAFRDAQGVLYFGGTNGLTSFNPRNITRNDYEPRVVISGLSVENETFNGCGCGPACADQCRPGIYYY